MEKNWDYTHLFSPQTQLAALVTLLTKGRLISQGLHLIVCALEGGTWKGTQANFLGIHLKREHQCGVVPLAGKTSLNIHALSLEKNKSFGGAGGTLEAADSIFREESPQTLEFEEAKAVGSPGSQLHRVGWCRLCGCCGEDNKSF